MSKRHEMIGVKQDIRLEWLRKTANLILAGLDADSVRQELLSYISDRKGSGDIGERSSQTRDFVVTNLMRVWVTPDDDLIPLRDSGLALLRRQPSADVAVHWGMICASYPFWFNVAWQIGRLGSLQDEITKRQVVRRLKEQYGDRQTVSRYAQFVLRSFVAWGVLKDSVTKGCYLKCSLMSLADHREEAVFVLEAALHALPEGRSMLSQLRNHPALFPFTMPLVAAEDISRSTPGIQVIRLDLNEDLLGLPGM